jgi:hypothetical protein
MLTSAECRAHAEAKLAQAEAKPVQAEGDDRHRRRLLIAAEAWLHLASQLSRVEATMAPTQPEQER